MSVFRRTPTGPIPRARWSPTPTTGIVRPIRQLLAPITGGLRLGRSRSRSEGGAAQRLRIDWPQCRAHGLCAEIAPEMIRLDEWGYPLFAAAPLDGVDLAIARKAVQVCPTLALRLMVVPPSK